MDALLFEFFASKELFYNALNKKSAFAERKADF